MLKNDFKIPLVAKLVWDETESYVPVEKKRTALPLMQIMLAKTLVTSSMICVPVVDICAVAVTKYKFAEKVIYCHGCCYFY